MTFKGSTLYLFTTVIKFAKFIIFKDNSTIFQTSILNEINSNPIWNFRKSVALHLAHNQMWLLCIPHKYHFRVLNMFEVQELKISLTDSIEPRLLSTPKFFFKSLTLTLKILMTQSGQKILIYAQSLPLFTKLKQRT
jgi:hypothetical protein